MKTQQFPQFIQDLPEADLPVKGLRGWLVLSQGGQALFLQTENEVHVPQHHHGDQWGIVIEGKMELAIGGKTETYSQGDSYFIPAGTLHGAVLYPGFRAIDYFADKNRYSPK